MKFTIYFVLILISFSAFCQEYKLEVNPNWHKYSKITEYNISFKDSKKVYDLKNGRVIKLDAFNKDSLVFSKNYVYDKHCNVEMEINNLRNDTLQYENQYGIDNILESNMFGYFFYNSDGQLEQIRQFDHLGFNTNFLYNTNGLIERIVDYYINPSKGKRYKRITLYSYDKCGNITKSKNIALPADIYIEDSIFDNAWVKEYNYNYNNRHCIWTKRYIIENGNKKLDAKRILK